jgi:hypothetical protein
VGKHVGAIMPPIGEWAIALTCIVAGRFKAIVDTTERDLLAALPRLIVNNLARGRSQIMSFDA